MSATIPTPRSGGGGEGPTSETELATTTAGTRSLEPDQPQAEAARKAATVAVTTACPGAS